MSIESLEARALLNGQPWNAAAQLMRQDDAFNAFGSIDGTGQTIAIIDTGIDYNHPALGAGFGPGFKVIAGYDFFDNDPDPLDTSGHGTQVAGIIASSSFSSDGALYRGIAPGAKLVALRISDNITTTPLERIGEALDWVIDNRAALDISIVNISFGFGRFDAPHTEAILGTRLDTLRNAGVLLVASSGNGGLDGGPGISYPAAHAGVISVGSLATSGTISTFSQRGSTLDFFAPGESLRTPTVNGQYAEVGGTSFSSPVFAGALALVRQVSSDFGHDDVRSMLVASSPTLQDGLIASSNTTGLQYARLDLFSLVTLADQRKPASNQQPVTFAANNSDIAVDAWGIRHASYFDSVASTLVYATQTKSGLWSQARIFDTDGTFLGQWNALRLDRTGNPSIAYNDGSAGDLKFARLAPSAPDAPSGMSWSIERIDRIGSTGLYPSLVLDDNDVPQIAYYRRSSGDLRIAQRYPFVHLGVTYPWTVRDIDTTGDVGRSTAITRDTSGRLVIAYESSTLGQVKLARQTNDLRPDVAPTWSITTVTPRSGDPQTQGATFIDVVVDSANRPHVSFYNISPADLNYATQVNNQWQVSVLAARGATGLYTQIFLENDRPSIAFWNRRWDVTDLARWNGSSWNISTLRPASGRFIAVAPDPSASERFVFLTRETASARHFTGTI